MNHDITLVNNQTASLHQETDAPRSVNPRLAYGFRAMFKQAIGLDDHHKRASLCCHFPSPSSTFSEGRNSLPICIAIPACAIVSSSPAPDSPMAIYYA
jgi:hypothetical protein